MTTSRNTPRPQGGNRIGGSFAPPLTEDLLDHYESLAAEADEPVGDAMRTLLRCVRHWWELPDSEGTARSPHPSGTGTIVSLAPEIQEELWEDIPWNHELDGIQRLFDALPPGCAAGPFVEREVESRGEARTVLRQKVNVTNQDDYELRNAAFHLLWVTRELALDREPIFSNQL